jgi:hypothetical protein
MIEAHQQSASPVVVPRALRERRCSPAPVHQQRDHHEEGDDGQHDDHHHNCHRGATRATVTVTATVVWAGGGVDRVDRSQEPRAALCGCLEDDMVEGGGELAVLSREVEVDPTGAEQSVAAAVIAAIVRDEGEQASGLIRPFREREPPQSSCPQTRRRVRGTRARGESVSAGSQCRSLGVVVTDVDDGDDWALCQQLTSNDGLGGGLISHDSQGCEQGA